MAHTFDPGYVTAPFKGLCETYPDQTVYPFAAFRVEWGPIFHRGRLDGSARLLVIGQDPAQHEGAVRRVLIGEAGHRIQGFLFKLGLDRSYVIVNASLYSAYNQPAAQLHANLAHVDTARTVVPYGPAFLPSELLEIPEGDLPPGIPSWMRAADGWAARVGTNAAAKRLSVKVTVPAGIVPP